MKYSTHPGIRRGFTVSVMLYLLSAGRLIAQDICEWPSFHGADRTNKSSETGLITKWPDTGPELVCTVSGLGKGYSSVSIVDEHIYTAGMIDQQTFVFAFDMDGNLIWKRPNGLSWDTERSWARSYNGSRSTPTVDNGVVYHLGELGRLVSLDYRYGKENWNIELRETFDAKIPEYGYSESVLVDGDYLYCCPAGKKGFLVCLDKDNGKLIWANREIPGTAGFGSLVMFEHDGFSQLAGLSSSHLFGVDAASGKLLWLVEFANERDNNVADAIFHDGYVFASSGYGRGSMLVRLDVVGRKVNPVKVWDTELMDNHHGGVILHEGYLYGAGHNSRGWFCLDFRTGKQMWKTGGKGSITFADGMLYCLDERGILNVIRAAPGQCEIVSTFDIPDGGEGMHWAHPVVCGGRLYIRHEDKLFFYSLGG